MTEPAVQARPQLPAEAMDQALDWMIVLQSPSAAQCQAFDAWLGSDPLHADAYARANAAWGHATVTEAAQVAARPRPRSRAWPVRLQRLAIAAAVLAGVATLEGVPLRVQADHLTAVGERHRLQLGDGTEVLLNTESALGSEGDHGKRAARLYQGEAWFEVPRRSGLLRVHAGPVLAQANDSVFAVRLLDGQARVQVSQGQVELQDDQHRRLRLPAGMSVAVSPEGFGTPTPLRTDEDLAWVRGRLVFADCPLQQVLAELSRYYPGWIINTRAALNDRRVTGNYSLDDPAAVVRALARITSATVRQLPGLLILN